MNNFSGLPSSFLQDCQRKKQIFLQNQQSTQQYTKHQNQKKTQEKETKPSKYRMILEKLAQQKKYAQAQMIQKERREEEERKARELVAEHMDEYISEFNRNEQMCGVCMDSIRYDQMIEVCQNLHKLHVKCFDALLVKKHFRCPMCRQKVTLKHTDLFSIKQ